MAVLAYYDFFKIVLMLFFNLFFNSFQFFKLLFFNQIFSIHLFFSIFNYNSKGAIKLHDYFCKQLGNVTMF